MDSTAQPSPSTQDGSQQPVAQPPIKSGQADGENTPPHRNFMKIGFYLILLLIIVAVAIFAYQKYSTQGTNNEKTSQQSKTPQDEINQTTNTIQVINPESFDNIEEPLEIGPSTFSAIEITDTDPETINANIGKFTNAEKVFLPRNELQEIPNDIFELNNLTELWIASNNIEIISPKIAQLKKLKILNLISNQIKSIPKEIGQLESLEEFYISANLIDSIPTEIGNLKNLKILQIQGNLLSKEQMSNLESLLPNTEITSSPQKE